MRLLITFARKYPLTSAVMILALGLAILTEAFPSSERGRALGIGGATTMYGFLQAVVRQSRPTVPEPERVARADARGDKP